MKTPKWIAKGQEDQLEEMHMPIPSMGMVTPPPPATPPTPERELISRALAVANEQEQQQKELMVKLTEATLRIESYRRQIGEQSTTIATLQNNELNLRAQIEQLRQEASDLRAFFEQHRATLDYLLTRFDQYGVPKKVKNGDTQGKVLPGPQKNTVEEVKAEATRILNGS